MCEACIEANNLTKKIFYTIIAFVILITLAKTFYFADLHYFAVGMIISGTLFVFQKIYRKMMFGG